MGNNLIIIGLGLIQLDKWFVPVPFEMIGALFCLVGSAIAIYELVMKPRVR